MCPAQLPAVISCLAAKPPQLRLQPIVPAAMARTSKKFFEKCTLHMCAQWKYTKQMGHLKQNSKSTG